MDDSSNALLIASLLFHPLQITEAPAECSLVQALLKSRGKLTAVNRKKLDLTYSQYLDKFASAHDVNTPTKSPSDTTLSTKGSTLNGTRRYLSPAAQCALYLSTFTRKIRPLKIIRHEAEPPSKLRSSISILLPISSIPGKGEIPGPPQKLVDANHVLQAIIWHAARQGKKQPNPSHILPPCGVVGCDGACCPQSDISERLNFRLDRVYQQQSVGVHSRRVSLERSSFMSLPNRQQASSLLLSLPEEVFLRIVRFLPPPDLASLSACNPYLEQMLLHVVPGLRLKLFPHQIQALKRMHAMEALTVRDIAMPLVHTIQIPKFGSGCCLAVDLVDGSILFVYGIPYIGPPCGGLFCDEPGLGKTVTVIALILKSLGRFSRPPKGKRVYYGSAHQNGNMKETPFVLTKKRTRHDNEFTGNHPISSFYDSDEDESQALENVPFFIEQPVSRYQACGDEDLRVQDRKSKLLQGSALPAQGRRRSVSRTDFLGIGHSLSVPAADLKETKIYLSRATLIVVPTVLTVHWIYQLQTHVEEGRMHVLLVHNVQSVPSDPRVLANAYDVVIIPFDLVRKMHESMRETTPTLMRVHFRRLIIDEGHSLSSSPNSFLTNLASVCQRLRAESRWIMTGTPTPSTPQTDVDHLHSLLQFLREEGYGLDKKAWEVAIREPYTKFKMESRERLGILLSRIMIRADKRILPIKCHIRNVILDFSDASAKSYNGIVRAVRRNLITSDWFSKSHEESLLNPLNHQLASDVFTNLKLACCAGGIISMEFTSTDVVETLDILYSQYREIAGIKESDRFRDPTFDTAILEVSNPDDLELEARKQNVRERQKLHEGLLERQEAFRRLPRFISGKNNEQSYEKCIYAGRLCQIVESLESGTTICERCQRQTPIPMITPCGHLICDDCILLDKTRCVKPGCGVPYHMDKKGVPENLIELQPSATSEEWMKNWFKTSSAKVDYLVQRIKTLPENKEWEVGKPTPTFTKPKVIIHSEYPDHLKLVVIELRKNKELADAYVEMTRNDQEIDNVNNMRNRRASDIAMDSVERFKYDDTCNILLIDTRHGAVGLDLSFVQYIFLLEPVWDRAVELQIISRAHRIGCKRDIFVERLVMRDSVEHGMLTAANQDLAGEKSNASVRAIDIQVSGVAKEKEMQDRKRKAELLRTLKTVKGISEIRAAKERHDSISQPGQSNAETDAKLEQKDNDFNTETITKEEGSVPMVSSASQPGHSNTEAEIELERKDNEGKTEAITEEESSGQVASSDSTERNKRSASTSDEDRPRKRVCFRFDT